MQTTLAPDLAREALMAHLPLTLIEAWAEDAEQPLVWQRWIDGTLMLCDISGFTAMSERLAGRGKEGAELMTGILNSFFERMLGIAEGWGGVQMKFGGDAMLLLCTGAEHAARAAACALEMQRAMPEFRAVRAGGESHLLRMRVGMHSGRFLSASVGDPAGVLHYLFVGHDVNRAAGMEAAADPGQVVCSDATAALLPASARRVRSGEGVWRITRIDDPSVPPNEIDLAQAPSRILLRYLMPPIAVPVSEGRPHGFGGAHRQVTAVFINVLGIAELIEREGAVAALGHVDAYMKIVLGQLERHSGFLGGSDAADHGDKLIVLFGAPVSSERDEVSAVRFAYALDRALAESDIPLRHRIGISTGSVFAGEVGSSRRREYTVIGDSVNLAARLMTAAKPGQTFISGPTAERARAEFALHRLRPLTLKGKSKKIAAFRLEGEQHVRPEDAGSAAGELLGRDQEMGALLRLARLVQRAGARWAFVSGEPGIGKSRVVKDAGARLELAGWHRVTATCQAHLSRTLFAAWGEALRDLFGIARGDDPAAAWIKVKQGVARLQPERVQFAGLIADMLALPSDDEPMLRFLDARTRRAQLGATIAGVLNASAAEKPLFLLFDDIHLADSASLDLLAEVIGQARGPLFFCATSRRELPDALAATPPALALRLDELSHVDARRLAAAVAGLDTRELDDVVGRAQGNPLFVQQMALSVASGEGTTPHSINEVILARIDHLPPEERTVLRAASVIGSSFSAAHVAALLREGPAREGVAGTIGRLTDQGFTSPAESDATHAFAHVLAREVIYETLPFAQRREMHGIVAHEIEREHEHDPQNVSGLLLHHYSLATDAAKTVQYAVMTGDRAAAVFANREAIEYYGRALDALGHVRGDGRADRSLVLERIGDCLETEGRHRAATQAFRDALDEWRSGGRRKAPRFIANGAVSTARESALCRRVAVSYERSSDYDEALRWLDEASAHLPARPGKAGAEVSASMAVTLFRKGDFRQAIEWGKRAVAIARRTHEPRTIAYAQNMLANGYIAEGSLKEAIRYLRPSVELYREAEDIPGQAAANNNLGTCYQLLGVLDLALQHYEVALAADERVGDLIDAAIIHNNIGEVLLIRGDIPGAIAHLEQVLIANGTDSELDGVAGLSQINLCRCEMVLGNLEAAEEHVRKGLRLMRRVGAEGLVQEGRLQLAELRLAQGRPEEAMREARRALRDAEASDAKILIARGERIAAGAAAALGDITAAKQRLAASTAIAARIGAEHEEARSLVALAKLQTEGDPREQRQAAQALSRAAAMLGRMGASREHLEAQQLLAALDDVQALATMPPKAARSAAAASASASSARDTNGAIVQKPWTIPS